jgi:serine/threonine protein kinase
MPAEFDPYHRWLGIPPREQPPNHYRLLGVQIFEQDADVIETAADQRTTNLRLHEDGKHGALAQRLLKEVSEAEVCLLLPERKAKYDEKLRRQLEATSEVGTQLGEYVLEAKLGEGGMGAVYRARHTKLGRLVAVKVLSKGRLQDRHAATRFEREIAAIGRISHPNIVSALDAREIAGTHFLVMEYVEGMHLGEILRRCGPLSLPDTCALVFQTALGLQCAHENGLVHRDIKPSNLMLTAQGVVKILDLGLVRIQAETEAEDSTVEEVTGMGQALGTVDYMAPEQVADSRSVDIRADIYSLGITCYKLLSGQAPFSGSNYRTAIDKLVARVQKDPPPINSVRRDVPPPLAALIARMLARDPTARYATPRDLAEAIHPWTAGCNLPALLVRAEGTAPPGPEARGSNSILSASSSRIHRPVSHPSGELSTTQAVLWRPLQVWAITALATAAVILVIGLLSLAFSGGDNKAPSPPPPGAPAAAP